MTKLNVALIGAGSMGSNHARILADLGQVQLQCVVDANKEQAEKIAHKYCCDAVCSLEEAFDNYSLDAVVIATPTVTHLELMKKVLERDVHIFLEKPAFANSEESKIINDILAKKDKKPIIMVGHIERFNPAVMQLKKRLKRGELGTIYQIDIRRQGPFPTRIADVGVVLDLSVHDLDLLRFITGSEIERIHAECSQNIHSSHEDMLLALIRLQSGTQATLNINWLTPTKNRDIHVIGEKGMFRVDLLTQDLYFYENALATTNEWENMTLLRGVAEGTVIKYTVPKKEPLRVEHECFVNACLGQKYSNFVDLHDGQQAVKLAETILQTMLK